VLDLHYGGLQRLVAELVRRIDRDRFEAHVLAVRRPGRFAQQLDGYTVLHRAEALPRYTMLWPRPLTRQIRTIAPDVVHIHSGVWYKASLAARHAGVCRVLYTDHGRHLPDPWQGRVLDWIASRRTDVVVAVSEALAHQLKKTVVSDASRVQVVCNGVDPEVHLPRPDDGVVRRELGIPEAAPVIGSVGRLEFVKGYDVMVEAFARLRARWEGGAAPILVVAGGGSEREHLAALVEGRGLTGAAHLMGWCDRVHSLHAASTLYTVSSRSEGTSVSLLEAMSAAVCPVATDVGGNASVLGAGLRHRLVPPEDPDALAAAWLAALRDPVRRATDARLARQRVQEAFSLQSMVRAYERLYLQNR
jgi:glycosyltransferase involved in cell wall biosynthesis